MSKKSVAMAGFAGCLAGVLVGWAVWLIWPRPGWALTGPFTLEPLQPPPACVVATYDHVQLLAGIDEAGRRSEEMLARLRQETPKQPATDIKIAFIESRLSHLRDLAAFLETYFRKGFVQNVLCYGDAFLDREVYYPSFQLINAKETLELLRSLEKKSERFSWLPLVQSLGSAIVTSATTLLVFFLTGKREKKKAEPPLIVKAP